VVAGGIGGEGGIKPADILVPALLANAASVLLFRCRPGRDLSVRHEEFLFARRIAEAGELLGVKAVDFLVVGDGARYRSLHEGGLV
jgi:DNA repair protein RadC